MSKTKKATSAKRGTKPVAKKTAAKKTTTKTAVSKNSKEMKGKNPTAKKTPAKKNAQNELQGAVKTRFESTKELISSGFTKAKDFIVDCFNGIVDFIKGLFETAMSFFKGLFSKEQWNSKSGTAKNIFNVIALVAVACILGQLTIAAVGWEGLAIGASALTVGAYVVNRVTMEKDEKETAGPVSIKEALLPVSLVA